MASYNKVLLMGNLTRDIETRQAGSTTVANIGLAVNRKFRTQSGEDREETTYVDCEAWGRTAEVMAQYLAKGRPVFIEGRLKLDTWQDKQDGSNRSKLKIVVEGFQFIDSGGGGGGGGGGQARGGGRSQGGGGYGGGGGGGGNQGGYENYGEPVSADDIPF